MPSQFSNLTKGESQLLIAQGYDHIWILNRQTAATTGPEEAGLAAPRPRPVGGRSLTIWTDQPGVQFYSGNFLTGTLVGIGGHTTGRALGTPSRPGAPNSPKR